MILQQQVDDFHQYPPPPPFGLVVFKRQFFSNIPYLGRKEYFLA